MSCEPKKERGKEQTKKEWKKQKLLGRTYVVI